MALSPSKPLFVLSLAAATAAIAGFSEPAAAFSLGTANDYNVFVFEDFTGLNSDSWGAIAVGGDANFTNYGIASRKTDTSRPSLVVGGDLSITNGQVYGGDAYYGGTLSTSSTGIPNGQFVQGSVIDFAAEEQFYQDYSLQLSELTATETTTYFNWGGIRLDGSAELNVFDLDGSQFSSTNNFVINAPSGSTVLVNVSGADLVLENFGMQLQGGITQNDILFNFFEADSIETSGLSFQGSALAPSADFSSSSGNFEGTLIARSADPRFNFGSGEFHEYAFSGELPVPTAGYSGAIPEPTTIAGMGLAAALFGWARRKQAGARTPIR